MGHRYRPPRPKSSAYITPEGHRVLAEELEHLWHVERPRVTQAVSEAAAEGDRSENAEYIYGKRRLRQSDARVRFLTKRLEELQVVDPTKNTSSQIFFGAWVRVEDEEGDEHIYRIVGPDEFDSDKGFISMASPMAKAMLKKSEGDEVLVKRPRGDASLEILAVQYTPFTP